MMEIVDTPIILVVKVWAELFDIKTYLSKRWVNNGFSPVDSRPRYLNLDIWSLVLI